jgi:2-C-methyl-D-erythritol 4-phosphate cytidylyltransferase/2-C-methyl-D-erythritol 2,4-cyclodiphosphate synthase
VLECSLAPLRAESRIESIVVALRAADEHGAALIDALADPRVQRTEGGASRAESVLRGLDALAGLATPADWVLVHDAARPCLSLEEVRALLTALEAAPAGAVLAAPLFDTVKREAGGVVAETVDRSGLWRALTPQVFRWGELRSALLAAAQAGIAVTDESQAMERSGVRAVLVPGSPFNIKVTRAEDLAVADVVMRGRGMSRMRIGQGCDVHAFGEGDHVVLGGVRIGHARGIVAHSDGDVVIHALCDAILGALGAGDIGQHFPDTDPRYRGADSRLFLREVAARMRASGYALANADVTVLAEAPRIAKHRAAMVVNLAADLGVDQACVNVKATTTERLGFLGRGEGLAALATVMLQG